MEKRSAITGVLAAAATVVASTLVMSSPAQAAYVCAANEVCLYQDWGLHGSVKVFRDLTPGNGILEFRNYSYTNGANLNDSVSSIYNRSGYTVVVWEDGDYNLTNPTRKSMRIKPGQALDFNSTTVMPNDMISSISMQK
ncbi:peptidase inhibitor family I36 protein [Actinoplanes sp. L3-i22]|uniref:peptidase inhibitor family I36 protein n=1 Tax=Actinoplanes sp. L3-i22 TaxID=2836373 RepID=UPI001C799C11|nr:peptidase inhibitor family I36 protein [Actinoplanes sp. L3-i22]BCY09851.1 hypothetical protein L3i22_049390 [Actinoplanes sp. L3-i22]